MYQGYFDANSPPPCPWTIAGPAPPPGGCDEKLLGIFGGAPFPGTALSGGGFLGWSTLDLCVSGRAFSFLQGASFSTGFGAWAAGRWGGLGVSSFAGVSAWAAASLS